MIRLVQGSQKARFPREIDEMHQLRARVFHERLGWEVMVVDKWEIDIFDSLNPLYLLALDDNGTVRGSLRLLPTTGPNMLRDVFPYLLPEGETVESGTVWEASRLCVDHTFKGLNSASTIQKITGELLLALDEVGELAGLSAVVTVHDMYVNRILKRLKAQGESLAAPQKVGGVLTHVCFFERSDEVRQALIDVTGIATSVIEPASLDQLIRVA